MSMAGTSESDESSVSVLSWSRPNRLRRSEVVMRLLAAHHFHKLDTRFGYLYISMVEPISLVTLPSIGRKSIHANQAELTEATSGHPFVGRLWRRWGVRWASEEKRKREAATSLAWAVFNIELILSDLAICKATNLYSSSPVDWSPRQTRPT